MSDDYRDPSGNTEAFRAFVRSDEAPAPTAPPAPAANRTPLLIGGAVIAVVVIVVLVFALTR
ncbi:hypothetical protein [Asanoa ferruginea]|nr:hypothetical protein [Asanoa ferruginea]